MSKFFISDLSIHPSVKVSEVLVFGTEFSLEDELSKEIRVRTNFNDCKTIVFVLLNQQRIEWKYNSESEVKEVLLKLKNFLQNGTN